MLTYVPTINDFIAESTAEYTNDQNTIYSRLYNNGVSLHFSLDNNNKILHLLYIESKNKNKGNATAVIYELIDEFNQFNIIIEAIFFLKEWYEKFGFIYQYSIDEMYCYRMILKRKVL